MLRSALPFPQIYEVEVSEHALQRYRQRIGDATDEEIQAKILSARVWLAAGATAVYFHDGIHIYAKRGIVVTVTPDHWPPTYRMNKHGVGSGVSGRPKSRRGRASR